MFKTYLSILVFFLLSTSCTHIGTKKNQDKNQIYAQLKQQIINTNAHHLKECNCMKAFYRNLFAAPDQSARYIFDEKVGELAETITPYKESVSVLAIGAGKLLNELSAFANILARGKNLHIYLTDWAYVFYDDPDFINHALKLGNNPQSIPEGWKEFYFWAWAKNNEKPYLPFFEEHHHAIDEFKTIIANLDKIYNTQSTIEIIKPAQEKPVMLPELDMIISIDSFIDLPNLMWNLFYQLKLTKNPVLFIALNKNKPLGYFWESPDLAVRESYSLKPVNLEVYTVTSTENSGSYKLLEHRVFEATQEQIKNAPEFKKNPTRDSTQSPLD